MFKIKHAFQVTGRQFFILGEVVSGTIKIGMIADLKNVGLNKEIEIEAIEFALHRDERMVYEDIGLGFSGLSDADKEHLKANSPFTNLIVIKNMSFS